MTKERREPQDVTSVSRCMGFKRFLRSRFRFKVNMAAVWTVGIVIIVTLSSKQIYGPIYQNYNSFSLYLQAQRTPDQDWSRNHRPKQCILTALEAENEGFVDMTETAPTDETLLVNTAVVIEGKGTEMNAFMKSLFTKFMFMIWGKESPYYTPRKKKVNPIEAEFIINGEQICSSDARYMTILIIVLSMPSHYSERETIRNTYGSYSKRTFTIEHTSVEVTVRLMFLVGKDEKTESDRIIMNESMKYGDIVYADFKESYRNLTRKMLIALKWVSMYCCDVDFVLKVDEDVFVNVPQLAKDLHSRPYGSEGAVYGHINTKSTVQRKGKWSVSMSEFPLEQFPHYAAGNSYVISGNIVSRILMMSQYLPYMPIEDAFITGCLTKIVEAKLVSVPGFTEWNAEVPDPCTFAKERRISATKVTSDLMFKLWKTCNSYLKTCMNKRKHRK